MAFVYSSHLTDAKNYRTHNLRTDFQAEVHVQVRLFLVHVHVQWQTNKSENNFFYYCLFDLRICKLCQSKCFFLSLYFPTVVFKVVMDNGWFNVPLDGKQPKEKTIVGSCSLTSNLILDLLITKMIFRQRKPIEKELTS